MTHTNLQGLPRIKINETQDKEGSIDWKDEQQNSKRISRGWKNKTLVNTSTISLSAGVHGWGSGQTINQGWNSQLNTTFTGWGASSTTDQGRISQPSTAVTGWGSNSMINQGWITPLSTATTSWSQPAHPSWHITAQLETGSMTLVDQLLVTQSHDLD